LDKTADAVVIGGGILGASVAHFLAKRGFGKVVLLEKRTLAAVSTGHSAAVVRTYYSNEMTVKLSWRAVQMFENDREELGGDCSFQQIGVLILIDEGSIAPGRHVFETMREHGEGVRDISPEDIRELHPHLELEGVVSGIYETRSGYVDPIKTTQTLVQRAKEWGLVAYEGVAATAIRLKGGRVTTVETEDGPIATPVVVNAAGPWGREVGLWVGKNYSVRWSRESDLVLQLPSDFGTFPVTSDPMLQVYFRPQGDGKVLAGLGSPKAVEPLDIDDYDQSLDADTRQNIERRLFQRVPALKSAKFDQGWASMYTITDDWHPLVGPEPDVEGYYVSFGGSGHSFKLGPPIGEALADVVAGDTPKIDIHQLRPSRFAEAEFITSAWGGGNRA
jgi:sarcosine oxidase subunit beta